MTVPTDRLIAASGVSAALAGAIFIGVQINHPDLDVDALATTEMAIREGAKALMAVLALAGIAGMYLTQHRRTGALGLVGWLLLSVGYLAMFAVQVIVGAVLPTVAETDPSYVERAIEEAMGGAASGRIGHLHELFLVAGIGYALGGLLFGIALFRAGVLARWACALLAYGTVSTLTLAVLPDSFSRPFAVPTGIALIGLGVSLARNSRALAAPR